MKSKLKTIVFLENEQQYREWLKSRFYTREDTSTLICPLTPFAIHLCEKEKLSYILPESYFTREEYEETRNLFFKKINNLIELLDQHSRAIAGKLINFPLEIGSYFQGLLHPLVGSLYRRIFFLKRIIDKEKPDLIIAFKLTQKTGWYLNFLVHPNSDMYGEIISQLSFQVKKEILPYSLEQTNPWYEKIKNRLRNKDLIYRLRAFVKREVPSWIFSDLLSPSTTKKKKKAFIIGPLYSYRNLLKNPEIKKHFSISWRMEEHLLKLKSEDRKTKTNFLANWFQQEGLFLGFNIYPLIQDRLALIDQELAYFLKHFKKIKRLLRNCSFVFSSALLFPSQYFFAHVAKFLNKKIIVWVHGEKGLRDTIIFDEPDVQYSDYILTYGKGMTDYFKEKSKHIENVKDFIAVGLPTVDSLISLQAQNSGHILYATGKYLLNITTMSEIPAEDYLLYSSQKTLLRYLKMQKHRRVVFKQNPTRFLGDLSFISENDHSDNGDFKVIQLEKKFVDLLPHSSIIILDSPSTACVEASATKIPLFVILNRLLYLEEPLRLLKKRAVVTTSSEELIEKVERYFQTGIYEADVNNDEFARAYSTHLHDGLSTQRAADFFQKLCV